MADNPITVNLPAALPEDWVEKQIVAPEGQSVGLDQQHGYNYLMEQVNNAQTAASQIGAAFSGLATTEDVDGTLKATIQVTYNGAQPANPVAVHNAAPLSHQNLYVDGNNVTSADNSATLEEHMANPMAHQNLVIDGNAGQ